MELCTKQFEGFNQLCGFERQDTMNAVDNCTESIDNSVTYGETIHFSDCKLKKNMDLTFTNSKYVPVCVLHLRQYAAM